MIELKLPEPNAVRFELKVECDDVGKILPVVVVVASVVVVDTDCVGFVVTGSLADVVVVVVVVAASDNVVVVDAGLLGAVVVVVVVVVFSVVGSKTAAKKSNIAIHSVNVSVETINKKISYRFENRASAVCIS